MNEINKSEYLAQIRICLLLPVVLQEIFSVNFKKYLLNISALTLLLYSSSVFKMFNLSYLILFPPVLLFMMFHVVLISLLK